MTRGPPGRRDGSAWLVGRVVISTLEHKYVAGVPLLLFRFPWLVSCAL